MTNDTISLSPRHERFVAEFLKDGNATQAYIRAGYSPRGAQPSASRLLRDPRVEAAVAAGRQRITQSLEVDVQRIVSEYAKIAFASIDDFVSLDENGRLRIDLTKAGQAQRDGILELRIASNRNQEQTVTLKLGKLQALAALVKQFGVLVEKTAPGLTPADRLRYQEHCAAYERALDHREEEKRQLQRQLAEARAELEAIRTPSSPTGIENPNPSIFPIRRYKEQPPAAAAPEPAPVAKPAVEPGMPTEPPPEWTPGHLHGRMFWNTDRKPPPGPTYNDVIQKAGKGGFPGR